MKRFDVSKCVFCKIVKANSRNIIYQNEYFVVVEDIKPKADVHLLIISKKHIKNLQYVKKKDRNILSEMLLIVPKIARIYKSYDSFKIIINNGEKSKQEIDHMHFHFLGYK